MDHTPTNTNNNCLSSVHDLFAATHDGRGHVQAVRPLLYARCMVHAPERPGGTASTVQAGRSSVQPAVAASSTDPGVRADVTSARESPRDG
jgi:hypothetical protein